MIARTRHAWTEAVFRSSDYLRYDIRELGGADRRAMLLLGLLVIVGASCFVALESRRLRITAGAVVVLAAAAGLVIASLADPPSLAGIGLPCTNAPRPTCPTDVLEGNDRRLAVVGAALAAGYGIVALIRERIPVTAARRTPRRPFGAGRTGPPTTRREPPLFDADVPGGVDIGQPPKRRMSDVSLLALTVVAILIALVVGAFVLMQVIWFATHRVVLTAQPSRFEPSGARSSRLVPPLKRRRRCLVLALRSLQGAPSGPSRRRRTCARAWRFRRLL